MSSTLDVHWHPDVLAHDTGAGLFDAADPGWLAVPETHAENADRVRNMYSALHDGPYAGHLRWRDGRHATVDEIAWLHDRDYIDDVRASCETAAGGRARR